LPRLHRHSIYRELRHENNMTRSASRSNGVSSAALTTGTVQGLLRRAHILSAQHQRNHGTVQTQTSTTPHDQSDGARQGSDAQQRLRTAFESSLQKGQLVIG